MKRTYTIFWMVIFASLLHADEVVLKNGSRLIGTVAKLDGDKLILKTDYADEIKINWDAVSSFTAAKPLFLQTATETLRATAVTRADGNLELTTEPEQSRTIAATQLVTFRSNEEQQAYELSLHPGWFEAWSGGANFGLALARGNSSTTSIATGANLARTTLTDKTSVYLTTVYAKDNLQDLLTANAILGGIRYNHNITDTLFAYGSGDFESNDLQKLDLRSVLGGGLGWHAIHSKVTTFDVLGGAAWTHESYGTGLTNSLFSPSVGEQFAHNLSAVTSFTEQAFFYPYVTGGQLGEYRVALDAGFTTKISRIFAWQITLSDRYVTNPLQGTKGNDLLLSTGLALTLPSRAEAAK